MTPFEKKNDLLNRLESKELTMDRFLLECSRWTLDLLEEYKFKPFPIKPLEVEAFEKIPGRESLAASYFEENPCIMPYYDAIRKIKAENRAIREWLGECRKHFIKFNEFDNATRISKRLNEELTDTVSEKEGSNA